MKPEILVLEPLFWAAPASSKRLLDDALNLPAKPCGDTCEVGSFEVRRAPPAPSRERKAQKREARDLRCGGWGTGEHPFCARELAGAILRLESRVACLLIDRSFQVFSDAIPHRRQRFLKCPFLASYFSTPAMTFFGPRGRFSFIFGVFLH